MKSQTINVAWIGPSMNRIWSGVHWSKRKNFADEAHTAVAIAVKQQKIQPFPGAVELEVTPIHSGRHYDVSNYSLTCKAIEDGLVECGVLVGDSPRFVRKVSYFAPERPIDRSQGDCMRIRIIECE